MSSRNVRPDDRLAASQFALTAKPWYRELGPEQWRVLISRLGGYGATAMLFSVVYLLALGVVPFMPETKGKPLPA